MHRVSPPHGAFQPPRSLVNIARLCRGRLRRDRLLHVPPSSGLRSVSHAPLGIQQMAKVQNVSNVSVDTLRHLEVFAGLSETLLGQLLQVSTVCQLAARQKFSSSEHSPTERYCFVLDGAVAIALQHSGAELPAPGASIRPASDVEYIGYFEPGACFSDGFYAAQSAANRNRIDCIATAPTTLLQVESSHLAQLMAVDAAWRRQLTERVAA